MAITNIYKGTAELTDVLKIYKGSELIYESTPPPDIGPYLTFKSTSSFSLRVNNSTKSWNGTLEYSTNTTTWNVWSGTTRLSSVGNKLYLRGTGNTIITAGSTNNRWVLTGSNIECVGNIENLLDYETVALGNHPTMAYTMAGGCYSHMFSGCTSLTTAPSLPATTLANKCYANMFYGCTGLTTAPSLPSTTLASNCYANMFNGCASLTTVPKLPANTLADSCYMAMFYRCTALKVSKTKTGSYQYAWRIPTSGTGTTATDWNYSMFENTGGTFKTDPTINTTYYVENSPV